RGHPGQGPVRRRAGRLAARYWRSAAVHEYGGAERRERHDHRGGRPLCRPTAPRPHHFALMAAITMPVGPGLAAEHFPHGREMTSSPRLAAGLACEAAESEPGGAEMDRMTELALRRGAQHVTVGHGRSASATRAMAAFTRRWEACGRTVLDVVTWPEEAASW